MTYEDILIKILDAGIAAAQRDYARPDQALKLAGAIEGFDRCRNRSIDQLKALYLEADLSARTWLQHRPLETSEYWRLRSRVIEVEWVCNVLSAWENLHNRPSLFEWLPTARAIVGLGTAMGTIRQVVAADHDESGRNCGCDPGSEHLCAQHPYGVGVSA